MSQVCPISCHQVNERVAQVNAIFTVIGMLAFILTPAKWIIILLTLDFFVRGFLKPAYSLFNIMAELLLQRIRIEARMTNAGPKIFAARTGFVFVACITIAWIMQWCGLALVLASVLALFAALEAIFRFCVACKVYPLVRRVFNH